MESQAIVLERPGPLPRPIRRAAPIPGRGEVLLNVKAASVNYHDMVAATGGLPGVVWPRVPFPDASGEIVALGEEVHGFAIGDRVIPNFFPYWIDGAPSAAKMAIVLGDQIDGALQTHMRVNAACLARVPAHLSHREAATLGCAGLTAWNALFAEGRLRPGGTVLVQGTGGVSLFALGFAKLAGATVILTSSSEEKLERAKALGADHLVNYKSRPDWDQAVLELTGGAGADIVLDVGGGQTLNQSVNAAAIGGEIVSIGVLTGFSAAEFGFVNMMMKNLSLRGITVGSQAQLAEMCRAIAASGYRPVLDADFPLEEAEQAIQALLAQRHFGKITITVDDT